MLLTTYAGAPGPIQDNSTTVFPLSVVDEFQIADLDVELSIRHSRTSDLDVFLVSPNGIRVELFSDIGGTGDNISPTTLDDEATTSITLESAPFAGRFTPEGRLSDFDGIDIVGLWRLEVTDDRRREIGSVESWAISVTPMGVDPSVSINDVFLREQGDTIAFVESGDGGLVNPTDMVIGPDGNLYVGNGDIADSVLRYDGATGKFIDTFVESGSGGLNNPHGIGFGPDGNFYVASGFDSRILRYDGVTGAYLDEFVAAGSGGLDKPRTIVFRPDGLLYVGSDFTDQVLRFDALTGEFVDVFVARGAGGLDAPYRMSFGVDENLYVTSQKTNEILRFDGSTGHFLDVFVSAGSGGLIEPRDVAFDNGFMYVSSAGNDRVLRFNIENGEYAGDIPLDNSIHVPRDMLFDSTGKLLIGSRDSSEIRRIEQRFEVSLSHPSPNEITIDFSFIDLTAEIGADYDAIGGELVFAAGETTKSVLVSTIDDDSFEQDETFKAVLSNPSVGVFIEKSTGTGVILDNETTGSDQDLYAEQLTFESRTRGVKNPAHDERIRAVIRRDSDADGVSESTDAAVEGAVVTFEVTGPVSETFTLTTDATGTVVSDWIRKVPDGSYVASILSIELPPAVWNAGIGETDAFHTVPHPLNAVAVSRFSGDVTLDGVVTAADIDALHAAIRNANDDPLFDLNEDGSVDREDSTFLIEVLLNTFVGDANLDGEFNSRDLVLIFVQGEYEDGIDGNSGWASGDWNGDGDFNSRDIVDAFVIGGYDTGSRPQLAQLWRGKIAKVDAVFANDRFHATVSVDRK